MRIDQLVFKIEARTVWDEACARTQYLGSSHDLRDGFIHFSSGPQLAETARRHFANGKDLLLIAFDVSSLGDGLRWEPSRAGALFPHLYGVLDTAHALWAEPLGLDTNGIPDVGAVMQARRVGG